MENVKIIDDGPERIARTIISQVNAVGRHHVTTADYRAMIVCENYHRLNVIKNECYEHFDTAPLNRVKWDQNSRCFRFQSGATVYLAICQNEGQKKDFVGGYYHLVIIDHGIELPPEWRDWLFSTVRSNDKSIEPVKMMTQYVEVSDG